MKRLLATILYLSLIGCAAQADDPTDAPEITAEPTQISEATPTTEPTEPATETPPPTLIEATQEPEPTATLDPETACRLAVEDGFVPFDAPFPDVSMLYWQEGTQNERYLLGLASIPHNVQQSPDGRYLAMTFYHGTQDRLPIASTALIDTQGDQHTTLATSLIGYGGFYRWLPDGRFMWVDDVGQVYIDGTSLNAPEPIGQIDEVVGNIAFVQSADIGIWRVDLASGEWERVMTLYGPISGKIRGVSKDGMYALLTDSWPDRVWIYRVPIAMGTAAEEVMSFEATALSSKYYSGAGYGVEHLAGTNIWVIGGPFQLTIDSEIYGYTDVIVDLDAQKVLTAEDFGLEEGTIIVGGWVYEDAERFIEDWSIEDLNTTTGELLVAILAQADQPYRDWGNNIFLALDAWSYYTSGADLKGGKMLSFSGAGDGVGGIDLVGVESRPGFYITQSDWWPDPLRLSLHEMGPARLKEAVLDPAYDVLDTSWTYISHDDSEVYVAAIDSHPTPDGCENLVAIVAWEIEYP